MSKQLQPPVPLVALVKTEPPEEALEEEISTDIKDIDIVYHPLSEDLIKSETVLEDILEDKHLESVQTHALVKTVIKYESPEEALEEISTDVKEDIDIVYHPLCEDLIKSETVLEDILENKHLESVQAQALVKTENSPSIKTENITQRNKSEDSSDANVSRGTGQGVIEVQASNEHYNALSKLEIDEQSAFNFSKDLNSNSRRSRKAKQPEKSNFAKCYKTVETTSWKKDKEKIKIIKAPVISVEAHEYTSLANHRHVCNHCQHAYNRLYNLKTHIRTKHREVTTMYQCPYCPYKSKWSVSVKEHIIKKHKDPNDIQWFRFGCNKCHFKTYKSAKLKSHNLVHLKPEEIEYFYCYHCSYKAKWKMDLRRHIFRCHFKNVKQGKRFGCNKCNFKTNTNTHLKRHHLVHLKPEEIEYFYCYHCSYKSKWKSVLKTHIFRRHFKNVKQGKRFGCNKCNFITYTSTNFKRHHLVHLKPEEIEYFYCYHCSYKSKHKMDLKKHIFRHFKKEQVEFECYICNFMTPKRELIIKHIKKHSKVQNESEINEKS